MRNEELVIIALHAVILNTHYVILNEVKNLLNDNTLCALSLVGFEGMLRAAQHDIPSE